MKEVERKCIVMDEVKEKEDLLRFTLTPDGEVIPDLKKKLLGKGVYVSNSRAALQMAIDKNSFTKAFKRKAKVGGELLDVVEKLLKKTGLESISLARKAGALVTGFDKVSEAVTKSKAVFLLEAKNGAEDGCRKIKLLAKGLKIFRLYDTEELDKALDKVNTVHAAFLKSEIADKVNSDFKRLENFSILEESVE